MSNLNSSLEFRRSIYNVVMAIGLFFLLYILLLALSTGLLILNGYLSYILLSSGLGILSILAAGGLIAMGLMFFLFLVKFIFARHKDENPYRMQILEDEAPELFKLLTEISVSSGVKPPGKVFLRPDVNASVFYNSSFWSLFFPVKKNIDIGLGLINSVSYEELKAILAHEFGHFSQKSMRLNSYVFTVNKVIYNLVYSNDRWDRIIDEWSDAGGFFGFFGLITYKLADIIRMILRKAYNLINIQYLNLSREMEFHADQVAIEITGGDKMISALRRTEFCDIAFDQTFNALQDLAVEGQASENLYLNHRYEIKTLGNHFNLSFNDDLPIITNKDLDINTVKPRVIFTDQWASHPSREEREKRINTMDFKSNHHEKNSWSIFKNPINIQIQMTSNVYRLDFPNFEECQLIDNEKYQAYRNEKQSRNKINDVFNGFYDNRYLFPVNTKLANDHSNFSEFKPYYMKTIYTSENKLKFEKYSFDNNDLATLKQIKNKEIKTRFFEFDHKKYHRRDIDKIISKLEKELNCLRKELENIEEKSFLFNLFVACSISVDEKEIYLDKWKSLMMSQSLSENNQDFINSFNEDYYSILANKNHWHNDEFRNFNRDLIQFEKNYMNFLQTTNIKFDKKLNKQHSEILNGYLGNKFCFFKISSFDEDKFIEFMNLLTDNQSIFHENFIIQLKDLTDYQLYNYTISSKAEVPVNK